MSEGGERERGLINMGWKSRRKRRNREKVRY
jgi:hypothetical protein